jgi:glycosyltransferase A (GT-A) superfamily protein (DUF2064 family)
MINIQKACRQLGTTAIILGLALTGGASAYAATQESPIQALQKET